MAQSKALYFEEGGRSSKMSTTVMTSRKNHQRQKQWHQWNLFSTSSTDTMFWRYIEKRCESLPERDVQNTNEICFGKYERNSRPTDTWKPQTSVTCWATRDYDWESYGNWLTWRCKQKKMLSGVAFRNSLRNAGGRRGEALCRFLFPPSKSRSSFRS